MLIATLLNMKGQYSLEGHSHFSITQIQYVHLQLILSKHLKIVYIFEYKVYFDWPEGSDNVQIFVELKSMPRHIDRICYLCQISIPEAKIDISGIVYFKQDCLSDVLNNIESSAFHGQVAIIFTSMTMKSIHYYNKSPMSVQNNACVMLIDELINTFSV